MILQALDRYYKILQEDESTSIAPPDYCTTGVSFALSLNDSGELVDVFPLSHPELRGKKMQDVPRRMIVPEQVKRSGSNPSANFLCDNSAFLLGLSERDFEDQHYAEKRFQGFKELNLKLLRQADCTAARAVVNFLEAHNPTTARQHPVIAANLESLLGGGNLVFMVENIFVHDDLTVRQVWEAYKAGQGAVVGQCLVTGETAPIARLHPSLKRIRGAQPTGATLVGFNDRAYESFNRFKGQGLNAPVSEKATFAYTTALNYLLSTDNPHPPILLGDATVVYWAESIRPEYADYFAEIFGAGYASPAAEKQARKAAEDQLGRIAIKVQKGRLMDAIALPAGLDGQVRFYVLGLSPNSARISVRFFISEPFGKLVQRIAQHYADLEIAKDYEQQPDQIRPYTIVQETVSPKAKNAEPSPLLAGALLRAILSGGPYPAALYNAILIRVRADMDDKEHHISKINYLRAAVIKAFLLRKYRRQSDHSIQEVLTVSLNEQSTLPAYVLGRLFAVLEKAQQEAIGSVNASIKDRYFTSACASPATVFPMLLRLSQHHTAKADWGSKLDRRIQDLLGLLDVEKNPYPAHLTLDEQGIFILGYYHQRADFYKKSGEKSAETIPAETA